MRLAFWTVTRGAALIGKECREIILQNREDMLVDVYSLKKFEVLDTIAIEDFTKELTSTFHAYDGHIFIMASGIVVRKISTLLQGKDLDPAVLLMDEGKHFVISLLSGHLGGANDLTYFLAEMLQRIPVITTSSDITGKIAVDSIAQKLKAELADLTSAKEVTSLIVDGKTVEILLPKNVSFSENGNAQGIIILSNRKTIEVTRICPKNIILGIGCKKNTKKEEILENIEKIMDKHNLDMKSIKHIATVDVKEKEEGLVQAAAYLNLELKIISREEIKKVEHLFEGSDFVEETIGVRAVSEPVALLSSSQKGSFIVKKAKNQGMTISIYEEEV